MMAVEERTVRKGYKMTELGEIPVEWEVLEIDKIVDKIVGGGTPSRENPDYFKGAIPWVTVKDMDGSFYNNSSQEYINEIAVKESSANLIDEYQVIVATRIALGRGFINTRPVAINQDLKALYLSQKLIQPEYFLYWYLSQKEMVERMGSGSTVKGIRLEQLRALSVPIPDLKEQQKIAEILGSVDEQIENTEKLIKKTKVLKKGLMQQLLTKGIGHTEFKMTELGEIPVGWEVVQLQDLFDLVSRPIKMNDKQEYRLVTVKRRHGGIVERGRLLGELIKVKSQYLIKEGDFLISKRQIVHGACEVVRKHLEDSIVSNEYHTLLVTEKLDIEYFRWLSQTQLVMGYFLRASIGVHIEKMLFKLNDWYKYKIAVPSIEEQQKIAEILSSVDVKLAVYEEEKDKYTQLKKGLMQQLLTGKVRVRV